MGPLHLRWVQYVYNIRWVHVTYSGACIEYSLECTSLIIGFEQRKQNEYVSNLKIVTLFRFLILFSKINQKKKIKILIENYKISLQKDIVNNTLQPLVIYVYIKLLWQNIKIIAEM